MFNLKEHPHRRFNPLTKEWLIVSPHRTKRPWQGQIEKSGIEELPFYDPDCYLCPANERVGGLVNPDYKEIFVFQNDFAALQADISPGSFKAGKLLRAESERGICKVICFSPNHSLTLSRMALAELEKVVEEWIKQYKELGSLDFINHVQIFENRGEMMGSSNPHPHGQIWASESVPNETAKELISQKEYFAENGSCLLCDYLKLEKEKEERVVCENDHFSAIVPFWAIYPFEVIIGKNHRSSIDEFESPEKKLCRYSQTDDDPLR